MVIPRVIDLPKLSQSQSYDEGIGRTIQRNIPSAPLRGARIPFTHVAEREPPSSMGTRHCTTEQLHKQESRHEDFLGPCHPRSFSFAVPVVLGNFSL